MHLSLPEYRKLAVELVELACGGPKGRPEADSLYQEVTEHRDRPPFPNGYSSCGDLAHWLYYRLGVRLPWLNRAEHRGWTQGVNVSRLAFDAPNISEPKMGYEPGDVGIIWALPGGTDAHVFVILDDQQPRALHVAEYGQPGGRITTRKIHYRGTLAYIGTRALHRVLPLQHVLAAASAANALALPETPADWQARTLSPDSTDPLQTRRGTMLPPETPPTLRAGATGNAVRLLQERLVSVLVDGHFGARTHAAVIAFQAAKGLKPDGVVGPTTWRALLDEGAS